MNDKPFALITGATGGLGSAFCRKIAKDGFDGKSYNLLITGRSITKLEALKEQLLSINNSIEIELFPCNLSDEVDRNKFYEFIISNNFNVELLINVAGVDTQKAFTKYTEEKLVFQTRVTFEATVSITRFILSRNSDYIKILTISSICGTTPMPYFAIYSALKGALVTFFNSLRYELKDKKGACITTILPGSIPTRDDIKEDIKNQGLTGKLSQKSPDYIVEKSLKALKKHKKNYIPGSYNRFVAFVQKLAPENLKMKIIAKKFKNKEKDAF